MSPARTRTRARPSASRRDDLLDAAEALFVEHGVAATTVSEITDRAGVAKGTFYLYFDSKDHVVAGLHEREIAGMVAIVERTLARADLDQAVDLADELAVRIIDYWIEQREIFRAIREAGEPREIARMKAKYDQQIIDMFRAGIEAGIERGTVSVSDPERAAQFIYYGCQGVTVRALLAPGRIQRKALTECAKETIHKILRP